MHQHHTCMALLGQHSHTYGTRNREERPLPICVYHQYTRTLSSVFILAESTPASPPCTSIRVRPISYAYCLALHTRMTRRFNFGHRTWCVLDAYTLGMSLHTCKALPHTCMACCHTRTRVLGRLHNFPTPIPQPATTFQHTIDPTAATHSYFNSTNIIQSTIRH